VVPRGTAATLYRVTILSYLRFSLTREADRQDFEKDMRSILDLATRQSGYHWAEMGPSLLDPTVYLAVSEWDDVEQVRAWEHEEEHSGVMEKREPQYQEPLFHQRFVPWQRPAK
jgi:heme-degrading monooxygenase HmoA